MIEQAPFTMSVIDALLRYSQGGFVLTEERIRAELVRRLDEGSLKAVEVARYLGVAAPRITEMRRGTRRVQALEMAPVAKLLGLAGEIEAPRIMLPVALPSEDTLTAMMRGLLQTVGLQAQADEYAERLAQLLPGALATAAASLAPPETNLGTAAAEPARPRATENRDHLRR